MTKQTTAPLSFRDEVMTQAFSRARVAALAADAQPAARTSIDLLGRILLTMASVALLILGAAAWVSISAATAPPAPSAVDQYLAATPSATGYEYGVVAAGYNLCDQLRRGESFDGVVRHSTVDGIGGDLYPSGGVLLIAQNAQRYLCPGV